MKPILESVVGVLLIPYLDGESDDLLSSVVSAVLSADVGQVLEVVATEDQFDFFDADGTLWGPKNPIGAPTCAFGNLQEGFPTGHIQSR